MGFTFSQTAGTSGDTIITISATSREEITTLVTDYTLSNASGDTMRLPLVQRAYEPTTKYIDIEPSTISWDASGGSISLVINSNDNWLVVSDEWITIGNSNELSGSSGNTLVGIRCGSNTGATRNGGITGYCASNTAISATTTVQQAGGYEETYLLISIDSYAADATGATGTLSVSANCEWSAFSDKSWIDVQTSSGSGNAVITFVIDANTVTSARKGTITVINSDKSITRICEITQEAAEAVEPYLSVSPVSQTVPSSGGTLSLAVSSNVSWETTLYQNYDEAKTWFTLNKLNGTGDGDLTVTVIPTTGSSRTGSIEFYNDEENLKCITAIYQDGTIK